MLLLLFAVAASASRVVLEPKPHVLGAFKASRSREVVTSQPLTLHLALTHRAPHAELEAALMSTALPEQHKRTPFLTPEQISSLYATSDAEAVIAWLHSEGVPRQRLSLQGHGDWLELTTTVGEAQRLFRCHFQRFDAPNGMSLIRASSYSVPGEVAHAIDFVGGIKRLPSLRPSVAQGAQQQGGLVGPTQLRALFGIPSSLRGSATNGNSQSVAQFLGQYYSSDDLKFYEQTYNLPRANVTVVGPNEQDQPGVEAELDIDVATGIAQGTPTTFHSTGGLHDQQEPFLKWLLDLEKTGGGPYTHSISYGDVEASLDSAYAVRVCNEIMKLSTAGHTFFFASGDSGVSCNAEGKQDPDFPASCPYVTSVGGVVLQGDGSPESWTGSGGGFSNLFGRPSFADSAQQAYIQSHSSPSHSTYNTTGWGYPVISAISANVAVAYHEEIIPVAGTSCASPAAVALFTLLRDAKIASGNDTPLGYLNPSIYSWGSSVFTAVPAQYRNSNGQCQGFTAGEGWSPINGWGVPDYGKIKAKL